ncbi:hypothetical protein CRG98_049337, partial [Punica granatum]
TAVLCALRPGQNSQHREWILGELMESVPFEADEQVLTSAGRTEPHTPW